MQILRFLQEVEIDFRLIEHSDLSLRILKDTHIPFGRYSVGFDPQI